MSIVKKRLAPDYEWESCELVTYSDSPTVKGITKRVLIGPADGAEGFAMRYFEVRPGGNSLLEHHPWIHQVFVVRGRGAVLIGDEWHEIAEGDVIFIGPDDQHQLKAAPDELLGFLCVAAKP
jgi:quercetin dioxygenase-like cupin family protein